MKRFYRIKEICFCLGIGITALRNKIANGQLPPLEHPYPLNKRVAGYSHDTYQRVINMSNVTKEVVSMGNQGGVGCPLSIESNTDRSQ
jgi:hypothetical protein